MPRSIVLFLVGIAIGWLTGLSASSAAETAISALLTLAIAVTAVLAGVQLSSGDKDKIPAAIVSLADTKSVTVTGLAALTFGVALGAPIGVFVRSHEYLGPKPKDVVARWEAAGLDRATAAKLLLANQAPGKDGKLNHAAPVLFATATEDECARFRAASDDELEAEMAASHNERIREFAKRCSGKPDCLRGRSGATDMSRKIAAFALLLAALARPAFAVDHVFQVRATQDLTGFRVANVPGILTALHGVSGVKHITATTDRKGVILRQPLQIRAVHIGYDLAILSSQELDELQKEGYTVQTNVDWGAMAGKSVKVVGYPLNIRKQIRTPILVRDDPFVPLRNLVDAQTLLQLQNRMSPNPRLNVISVAGYLLPGHSGAPILDSEGRVIGIGSGGLKGGTVGHAWAVPFPTEGWESVNNNQALKALESRAPGALFKTAADFEEVQEFMDHLKQLERDIADLRDRQRNRGLTGASIFDKPSIDALYKVVVHPRNSMVIVTGNNRILSPANGVTIQKKGEFRRIEIKPQQNVQYVIKVWDGSSGLEPSRTPITPTSGNAVDLDIELATAVPNVNNLKNWQIEFGMTNTFLQRIQEFGRSNPNRRNTNQRPRTRLPSVLRNR